MQHVVSQLITKKEELSGELNFYKTKISQLEEVLNGIDISIKVFDPDFKLCSIKAKRFTGNTHYFKRGESHVLVLDILRKSQKPMKTHEIVIELMKRKELDYQDLTLVEKVKKTLLTTLKKQEKNNLIKVVDSSNGFTWAI